MKYLTFFLLFFICACEEREGPLVIPNPVFFLIKESGTKLPDSTQKGIKLFYLKGNTKNYVSDFERGADGFDTLGIFTSRNIGLTSGNENIKDYYLEYPNGDIDTLFVDYRHVSEKEAFKNSCYCYYPLEEVRFNGRKAEPDPSITMQKVYLFQKP